MNVFALKGQGVAGESAEPFQGSGVYLRLLPQPFGLKAFVRAA